MVAWLLWAHYALTQTSANLQYERTTKISFEIVLVFLGARITTYIVAPHDFHHWSLYSCPELMEVVVSRVYFVLY